MVDVARIPKALEIRLEEMSQLEDNWDGYGAHPISRKALEQARTVLLKACAPRWSTLPAPFLSPTRSRGVGMEWRSGVGKELLVEIAPDGQISYLL